MSALWSARAQAYKDSKRHAHGEDLDLLVEWCRPGKGVTALDVGTGGGHVARRLRQRGCIVTTSDIAKGMGPDVVCSAEELPFSDAAFQVVVSRLAPHHFFDIASALDEMARVASGSVVIQDVVFDDEAGEAAERLRDPSHVRSYSMEEWRRMLERAGLEVEESRVVEKSGPLDQWLALVGCDGPEADEVCSLIPHRISGDDVTTSHVLLRAKKVLQ